jgi:peptide subunit release factor 1 (eRF1)
VTTLKDRVKTLATLAGPPGSVVSVYLNTRWADEHQRGRTRLFLKNELRQARDRTGGRLDEELRWIEEQGEALVGRGLAPEAGGVALIASNALGLRETIPVREPFEPALAVSDRPVLTPLAGWLEAAPRGVVAFVDGARARLIPQDAQGIGEEVTLEHEVPGRHGRGEWAGLAQARYQRHIEVHRGQHFDAVVEALLALAERGEVERLVLAGETRALAAFRKHLPARLAAAVAAEVSGTYHEPASALVARAAEALAASDRSQEVAAVRDLLTEAAKGGRAVAGRRDCLRAVNAGAVQFLYLAAGFDGAAASCTACGMLQEGPASGCAACGGPTTAIALADALVDRVVGTGGGVEVVDPLPELAEAEGVVARLRYPLGGGSR